MNLVKDPWIPVVQTTGERTEASLLDAFLSGATYADLAVRPHERVALMRLLICIAQAALNGPENFEQWEKAPDVLPAKADEYLTEWQDSFNLVHPEKPFLQIAALVATNHADEQKTTTDDSEAKSGESSPTKKPSTCIMNFSLATGNNSTLFDHKGNDAEARPLPEEQIALNLITFQNFSPSGGASIVTWGDTKHKQVGATDAPCTKGRMYHSFLKGDNLAETIHLNLLTRNIVNRAFGNDGWGKPVWEQMPSDPHDGKAIANATSTYLGRLAPLARWIKLLDQSWMIWGRGFDYPIFPDFRCPEPSATSIKRKDDKGRPIRDLLKASHARGIWRQLAALVVKRRIDSVGGALALENVPDDKGFDIHVCALLHERATAEAYQESIFHVPAGMATDIGRKIYEDEVNLAEAKARRLGQAVEKWRREMDPDWEQRLKAAGKEKNKLRERLRSIATNHFWTAVEKNLPLLLAYTSSIGEDDNDKRKRAWRRAVHQSARESYELACGRESPRQLRAFALGLRILEREEIPDTEEQEE